MNIKFYLQGTKDFKKLYVRVYFGRLDVCCPTLIVMREADFDINKQKSKNPDINTVMQKLTYKISESWNQKLISGEIIDKKWLSDIVSECFNRPKNELKLVNQDHSIYFTSFGLWWIENHSKKWKIDPVNYLSERIIDQYSNFLNLVIEFEKENQTRIGLLKFSQDDMYSFIEFLFKKGYKEKTIKRHITRFGFFANRSKEHNFEVNQSVFCQKYHFKTDKDCDDVYLNAAEIDLIYALKLEGKLETVRDNFLISLYTGLRISDLNLLETKNIEGDYITITQKKTKVQTVIPLHHRLKEVIEKYMGFLPEKVAPAEFNKQIKVICKMAKIDNLVFGKVYNKDTKRKEFGYYPKYKLIVSHSARRSFISNYIGLIPDQTLASISGWTSSSMLKTYNKKEKINNAKQLLDVWNKNQ
jgi:integrase